MEFTRACKSSPAAMLTAIMGEAIVSVHPEAAESLGALVRTPTLSGARIALTA